SAQDGNGNDALTSKVQWVGARGRMNVYRDGNACYGITLDVQYAVSGQRSAHAADCHQPRTSPRIRRDKEVDVHVSLSVRIRQSHHDVTHDDLRLPIRHEGSGGHIGGTAWIHRVGSNSTCRVDWRRKGNVTARTCTLRQSVQRRT